MTKPTTMVTVPNDENAAITGDRKYLVLQDFWLKDICIRAGQIITDPVSKRWIQLRLISPFNDQPDTSQNAGESDSSSIEKLFGDPSMADPGIILATDGADQVKKRGRPRKIKNVMELPEMSEMMVNKMNGSFTIQTDHPHHC